MTACDPPWDHDSDLRPPRWREELRDLRRSTALIRELVSRDVKVRYRRSWIGVFWSMAVPVATLMVLSLVFSSVLAPRGGSYPLYLFPGLVLWSFFAQTSSAIVGMNVANGDLFRRVRIARTAPAIATVCVGLIHLGVGTLVCLALTLYVNGTATGALLTIPVAVLIAAVFTLGAGLLLAALAIDFYDLSNIYQSILPVLMFATPVLYPSTLLPPRVASVVAWNPLTAIFDAFRSPLTSGQIASPGSFLRAGGAALIVAVAGWIAFTRKTDELPYRG